MKAIKNGDFRQVVCKNMEEVGKALLSIPLYSHRREGVKGEVILFFKILEGELYG